MQETIPPASAQREGAVSLGRIGYERSRTMATAESGQASWNSTDCATAEDASDRGIGRNP